MPQEEKCPVPLPETEPEVGDRIPAPASASKEDNDIAKQVIAGDQRIGLTRERIVKLAQKDRTYQKLCSLKKEIATEPPAPAKELRAAFLKARRAYRAWLHLRVKPRLKKREIQEVRRLMLRRMHQIALDEASRSVQKIQQVLGLEHIKVGELSPEFHARLSARLSSQGMAVVQTLLEPLAAPPSPSPDESPKTPS